MKDYSFGDKEYQKGFILKSNISKDQKYIIVRFADGRIGQLFNTLKNQEWVLTIKKEQIQKAYDAIHHPTMTYSSAHLFERIRRYIAIKSKAKDIDKNKIFSDSLEYINRALKYDMVWTNRLPINLQEKLMFWDSTGFHCSNLTLDDADHFNLKEVKAMVGAIENEAETSEDFHRKIIGY